LVCHYERFWQEKLGALGKYLDRERDRGSSPAAAGPTEGKKR